MTDENPPNDQAPAMRELTDPRSIRALTHPVRLALLEVLATEGSLTATEAGDLIGESPTSCSFHFRQLEKYGFTEVAATGPGRQRRWKIAQLGMNFSDTADDAEPISRPRACLDWSPTGRSRVCRSLRRRPRRTTPRTGRRRADATEAVLFVTPHELALLNADIRRSCLELHANA